MAAADLVTVHAQMVARHFDAFARVEPIASLPVRAAQAGILSAVRVLPGAAVRKGQELATLGGPEIRALLAAREAAVHSAQARLTAASKALEVQRTQLALRLGTRQSLADAQSAATAAEAGLRDARAQLRAAQELCILRAPADGAVLALNSADGERVAAGQTVLTLQTDNRLWLKATYYAADASAVRVGMRGTFVATGDSVPVAVQVASVFATIGRGGGESVGLRAITTTHWLNGEFGTVTLNGPQRRLIAVPTRALILDHGRWWVLVHTAHGEQPQAVAPGPTRGWQTFIDSGLAPGARIVVENAYLEFHRGVSKSYQPPD